MGKQREFEFPKANDDTQMGRKTNLAPIPSGRIGCPSKCSSPMPWGDWATAFPRLIPIILFSICTQSNSATITTTSSRSNGIDEGGGGGGGAVVGRRLHCLSCVRVEGDTTMLDQFRVRHGLLQPYCDMEAVQCDLHQDACVTITMQISQRRFWVGSGCDQRVNYDFPSGGREGCVEMPAVYRNFHPGFMEERRTLQRSDGTALTKSDTQKSRLYGNFKFMQIPFFPKYVKFAPICDSNSANVSQFFCQLPILKEFNEMMPKRVG
uniref:Uncharacterized protein n=1 Tax=Globodera rostochiensis TaxID=31243 RepID=A0A914GQA5_GLORO